MMTDEEFLRIAGHMKQRYGIDLSQKKVIMNGRLENHIKSGGWSSFHAFMNDLEKDSSGRLEKELVNLLTTNHTYFMREFEHFEFFKSVVLPELKQKEQNTKDLRIWCGAASTGEEPYMIAMVLKDFFGLESSSWDTKVLATDISTKVLQQAIAGIYNEEQLKSIPDQWKRHFFKKTPEGMFMVKDELKQEVIFRQFNLMSPFPFKKRMHTIFLRNVMIYFDENTKNELLQKVYDFLEPGGYLFIGMTETVDRAHIPFELVQPSIFRKQGR
ncbi:MAG: protein-glutamate O-methyltransferase CheR [Lachnospiraceae bacterium]|nr:protein-glutamate O-methyltransferase CheR [Lachnospiraceae bacterium]